MPRRPAVFERSSRGRRGRRGGQGRSAARRGLLRRRPPCVRIRRLRVGRATGRRGRQNGGGAALLPPPCGEGGPKDRVGVVPLAATAPWVGHPPPSPSATPPQQGGRRARYPAAPPPRSRKSPHPARTSR